jgi:hypothetical protein
MDKSRLLAYLEALDEALAEETELVVYGSAAFILLDEDGRTSLDIDVAAPYSRVNYVDGRGVMNPREQLEKAYALAFDPASLNELWGRIKRREIKDINETAKLVDLALLLHQALPESGYASQRALKRLAIYQARGRAFSLPCFLRNIRKVLGANKPLVPEKIPSTMVRDIALPKLSHHVIRRQ